MMDDPSRDDLNASAAPLATDLNEDDAADA